MNVLTKLEATLVFLRTSYVPSVILLHKLAAWFVNHISEDIEPNKCIVHGQIGTYVLFNTNYVKYTFQWEQFYQIYQTLFLYNIYYVKMIKYITYMHYYVTYLSYVYY